MKTPQVDDLCDRFNVTAVCPRGASILKVGDLVETGRSLVTTGRLHSAIC